MKDVRCGFFSLVWLTFLVGPGLNLEKTQSSASDTIVAGPSRPPITRSTEIHSSFNDVKGSESFDIDSSILQKVVQPELTEKVEEIVLTLSGAREEERENATEERYIVQAHPRDPRAIHQATPVPEEEVTEVLEAPENSTTEPAPTVRVTAEDIPSFSEWTQLQLAERKKADPNVTERVRISKIRNKNYASPDCGAKIVAANPEAVSASSVLTSSRDEYMLNHCTARIWFIIELCEAIQAKQIDLANFELFSSSPKEFSVSLGTRFPSRDWSSVGRFSAQDSRGIQTFDLEPQLFGKFLKVELHSHYGKEHYCPLSWVRVFGTSEYEVLATEDDGHGDDDDDEGDEEAGDVPRNLFSSATDAVLSIVKKATAPFLPAEKQNVVVRTPPSLCVSPRYLTVCNNCSEHTYDNVFYLLSCQQDSLYQLIMNKYVQWIIIQTDTCVKYGLDFSSLREGAPFPLPHRLEPQHYLTALLKESYIVALCNAMAVIESRVVVNMSLASPLRNLTVEPSPAPPISVLSSTVTCDVPNFSTTAQTHESAENEPPEIKPTRTLREEDVKKMQDHDSSVDADAITATPSIAHPSTVPPSNGFAPAENQEPESDAPKVSFVEKAEETEQEPREQEASLDAILKDLRELEKVVNDAPSTSSAPPPGAPKDSIFLRLTNRIKALELNMSLSSSYLEELSRRYRIQSELLGQTVNATAMRLEQHSRSQELDNRRKDSEIAELREQLFEITIQLNRLVSERDSWFPRPKQILWAFLLLTAVWYYLSRWKIPPVQEASNPEHKAQPVQVKTPRRRNSVECVTGHVLPVRPLERRPSDEALEIAVSTNYTTIDRKRRKKRKEGSRKTSAVAVKRKKSDVEEEVQVRKTTVVKQMSEPPSTPQCDALPTSNRFAAFSSPAAPPPVVRRFSSPAFMKTAMSSRVSRVTPPPDEQLVKANNIKKESGFKKYMRKLF